MGVFMSQCQSEVGMMNKQGTFSRVTLPSEVLTRALLPNHHTPAFID